jgi:hypothetical protein
MTQLIVLLDLRGDPRTFRGTRRSLRKATSRCKMQQIEPDESREYSLLFPEAPFDDFRFIANYSKLINYCAQRPILVIARGAAMWQSLRPPSISRSRPPFPVRRPVGWSSRWEGEAPASPSGVWTILRLSAGLVPRPPSGRIISVSIWKWNHGLPRRCAPRNDGVNR